MSILKNPQNKIYFSPYTLTVRIRDLASEILFKLEESKFLIAKQYRLLIEEKLECRKAQ